MAFTKDHRAPAALTGIARGTVDGVYGASVVSDFLPIRETTSLTFDVAAGENGLPRAASFRSFNTESDVSTVPYSESRSGKLPPISRRLHVDEFSQLKLTGGDLGATFEDYTRRISAEVATRLVQAAADAIELGKTEIEERDLKLVVDFGRKSGLAANAVKLWSDPTADVLGDLEALRDVYGATPGRIHIPTQVLNHLTRNTGLIQFVVGRGSDLPARVSHADVLSVLAQFNFNGVFSTEERFVDNTGTERYVFSSDKVLFLPGAASAVAVATGVGALGTTQVGVAAESLQDDNGIGGTPGVFAGAIPHHDPEGFNVLVSGIALPVLGNVNAAASLKVL